MALVGRVHAFASRHGLWTPRTPVIAAVSGGGDSVALLLILHELAAQGALRLEGVAHLNHRIRGEAEADAALVRALADRLEVPFELEAADVPALARAHGVSLEVAGRRARLRFFEWLTAGSEAVIALAHTRTDQAETVVLRLARGAGPRGLAGMAPRAGRRVRPLLEVSRAELRAWLALRGEPWREDETNADTAIPRNYVRHTVLPALTPLNASVEAVLARTARIHAADARLLDELAAAEAERLLQVDGTRVVFSWSELRRLPEALARRVARRALLIVDPARTPGWASTEAVLAHSGGTRLVGRVRLEQTGDSAVLSSRGSSISSSRPAPGAAPGSALVLALEVPGAVSHPAGWWRLEAEGPAARGPSPALADSGAAGAGREQVVLDAAAVGRHLTIRGWRAGDRVQPLGLGGRKKLQDVFVDRKVPRDERSRVPVVVDAHRRIVWVAGHVVGEPFRVTPHSEAVVTLTLRR